MRVSPALLLSIAAALAPASLSARPAAPGGTGGAGGGVDGGRDVAGGAIALPQRAELARRAAELGRRAATAAGVVPLLGLERLADWLELDELDDIVRQARQPRAHPLVRGRGHYLASLLAGHRGRLQEAAASRAAAGFLESWLLCGPFDDPDKRGLKTSYPVEQDLGRSPDQSAGYPGKGGHEVAWRPLPVRSTQPGLPLEELLAPARDAVVYLQAAVRSRRPQAAALRLGTSGPFKVFVGPAALAAREVTRQARLDQDTVPLWLEQGINRLTVKLVAGQPPWRLLARLTGPDGSSLEGIDVLDQPVAGQQEQVAPGAAAGAGAGQREIRRSAGQRKTAALDLGGLLGARLAARPNDPSALRDATLHELWVGPADAGRREAEALARRWVAREPGEEALLALAAAAADPNDARAALERAVSLRRPSALARLLLAERRVRDDRPLEGLALARALLASVPGFVPAELLTAEIYRSAGLEQLAARLLDDALARERGGAARLVHERAHLAMTRGDIWQAETLYRRYLGTRFDDVSARRALADLLLRRGEAVTALDALAVALDVAPHLTMLHRERARLLESLGRHEEAVAEYRAALVVEPRSPRLHEELGRAWLRSGQPSAARTAFRRALELQPQNAELRRYLAFLEPQRSRGAVEDYRRDPAAVIAEGRRRGVAAGERAAVLLDLSAREVHPSGLSRSLHQRLVLVGDKTGAERAALQLIQFSPDRQSIEIRAARIHRAAGGTLDVRTDDEQDLNEPWAGLWYDLRARVLRFPALRPGDVVEVEYLVEDIASGNMFADYFGELVLLRGELPVRSFEHVLLVPGGRVLHLRHPRLPQVVHESGQRDGRRLLRWTAKDLPGIDPEPLMPGLIEVADYIHVSTYSRWEDVARWYHGLVKAQLSSTETVRETARRLTRNASTEMERIRAIHGFVAKQTRYVGLELGIHGYKPYPVAQVLARKFGDCKDKASLLVALLAEVGIEAWLVLVRTWTQGEIEATPASLASFNHAVAYLPRQGLYLDGTADFAGTTELPGQDQGVLALHIDGKDGRLDRTPTSGAAANKTVRQARVELAADGEALVREEVTVTGAEASSWRRRYQVADNRRQLYEQSWARSAGSVQVKKLEMPAIEDLERPVRATAELQVPELGRREQPSVLEVRPLWGEPELVRRFARLSTRKHSLVLDHPWSSVQTVRLLPPAGWRASALPAEATRESSFGSFSRRASLEGGEIVLEQRIELTARRIAPAAYAAFRRFLAQVDRLASEKVTLVHP